MLNVSSANLGNLRASVIGAFLLMALTTCQKKQSASQVSEDSNTYLKSSFAFTPKIGYAKLFTISVQDRIKTLIVRDPWKSKDTLVAYALYPKGSIAPKATWADFIIPVPIEEVVATSSPHIGFLSLLEEIDKITGVAEDRYLYNQTVYEEVQQGHVKQIGSLKNSNLETLLDLSPDLIMKTGVDNVRNDDERLIEAGIPISYNVEWMENDMLARAEWVKFVGAFFDQDEKADSIFKAIEMEYLVAKKIVVDIDYRPFIMTGNNFKGTWYMPGANSYLTKLIIDAGGDYEFKNENSTGSIPLSFEVVLERMIDADYWIGPRAKSLKELEMMDERYHLFKAFNHKNVYTFNKRMSDNGGNDYWESGMTRPDLILKDVIKILHPELLPEHQLYYYQRLQ